MLSPEDLRLLDGFAERRFVALSEAEAAELGSGTLGEWRVASPDGVHVDAHDYADVLRDGLRWRRLVGAARRAWHFVLAVAAILLVVFVLGAILAAVS